MSLTTVLSIHFTFFVYDCFSSLAFELERTRLFALSE